MKGKPGRKGTAFREIGKGTAGKGIIYVGGEAASSLVSLLVIIYLARALPVSLFGLYIIAIAFTQFLGVSGNFGLGTALRKMLPGKGRKEGKAIMANGFLMAAWISAAIAVAGAAASSFIAIHIYGTQAMVLPVMMAFASVFLYVVFNMSSAALVGSGMVAESVIGNLAYSVSQLVATVALVSAGYGIGGAMVAFLASLVVGFAVEFAYLLSKVGMLGWHFEKERAKEMATFSAPVAVSNIANIGMGGFAIILLGAFASHYVVGNYGAAAKLGVVISLIIASNTFLLLPAFSRIAADRKLRRRMGDAYNNSVYYTSLFLLPFVAYLVAVSKPLILALISRAYPLAPEYFSVMAIGLAVGSVGLYAGTTVVSLGNTMKFMRYQLAVLGIEAISALVLIPVFGAAGALASIFVITPISAAIVYAGPLRREFGIMIKLERPVRVAMAAIVLGFLLAVISLATGQRLYSVAIDAAAALVLYPPILALAGGIGEKEVSFIRESTAGMMGVGKAISLLADYVEMFIIPVR